LGTPAYPEKALSQEAIDRSKLLRDVQDEMDEFGDMVMLPVCSTHFWFFFRERIADWDLGG
jgi:hypothetical protein